MKKIKVLILSLLVSSRIYAQQSITIVPNPSANGTLSSLAIDVDGKLIKTSGGGPTVASPAYYNLSNLDLMPSRTKALLMDKFVRDDALNNGTCYFETNANTGDWMLAPVDLPDGSALTNMKAIYFDHYNPENMTIQLIRRTKAMALVPLPETILASITTSSTINRVMQTSQVNLADIIINNDLYQYFIKVIVRELDIDATYFWGGSALAIRNVELKYNR